MTEDTEIQLRNDSVVQQLEEHFDEMERYTESVVTALRMNRAKRRLAEKISRKVGKRRNWFGGPKHSPVQKCCLDMLIRTGLAAYPMDEKLAVQIARYYSDNYAYEWCRAGISRTIRLVARDMILRGADSSFGETPAAAHLAYVIAHHQELGVENVSRYRELTTCNLDLERVNFFRDAYQEMREDLELDEHVIRAMKSVKDQL